MISVFYRQKLCCIHLICLHKSNLRCWQQSSRRLCKWAASIDYFAEEPARWTDKDCCDNFNTMQPAVFTVQNEKQ